MFVRSKLVTNSSSTNFIFITKERELTKKMLSEENLDYYKDTDAIESIEKLLNDNGELSAIIEFYEKWHMGSVLNYSYVPSEPEDRAKLVDLLKKGFNLIYYSLPNDALPLREGEGWLTYDDNEGAIYYWYD